MSTTKKSMPKQNYEVLHGYRDPASEHWKKKGEIVSLTKLQASGLLMGKQPKIKIATVVANKEK